jgi:hypothetical protein
VRTISFTRPATSGPSFLIAGASGSGGGGRTTAGRDPLASLRLDRIDSRVLLAAARRVLFAYLEEGGIDDPIGVVLNANQRQGRVVFELPVLLPDEQFVPLDLIRGGERLARGRRSAPSRMRLTRNQPPPP